MQRMLMPSMGEWVKEGRVLCLFQHEGDLVKKDEPLLEVETDKINVLVEATASGVLRQLLVREGEIVSVGTPLACINELDKPLSDPI